MKWVKCRPDAELLGQREGHCAAVLVVTQAGEDGGSTTDHRYVLVFGGYGDGPLSTGEPILSPVDRLPQLNWRALPYQKPLECDGASLTATDDAHEALLFGGLDLELERRNTLFAVRLSSTSESVLHPPQDDVPRLILTALSVAGDVPSPRCRHGAGFSQGVLYIFGGETDTEEQSNDLYTFTKETCVWRRVGGTGCTASSVPSPRLLSLSLVFVAPSVMIMYGGSRFVDGHMESLDDVWVFNPATEQWRLESSGWWPRCNGHRGGRLSSKAFFVGGKDSSTGDDRVRGVCYSADTGGLEFALETPGDAAPDGPGGGGHAEEGAPPAAPGEEEEGEEEEMAINSRVAHPHWRYTPAMVEVPSGLLLLGGQCRHPQQPAAYLLAV